jgi:hypothetical protein
MLYMKAVFIRSANVDALASEGEWVKRVVTTMFHPVGTCRMGQDARAVVDARLRVRGGDGLRVIDSSIMPKWQYQRPDPGARAPQRGDVGRGSEADLGSSGASRRGPTWIVIEGGTDHVALTSKCRVLANVQTLFRKIACSEPIRDGRLGELKGQDGFEAMVFGSL